MVFRSLSLITCSEDMLSLDTLTLVGELPDTTILTESPMVTLFPLLEIFTSSTETGGITDASTTEM